MEEGQTVEIQETREPLREQGSIRALLELLEQQGMEQEKGDVLRMADYIDSMEMQLGTVLKELGEVKKQLGVMQKNKSMYGQSLDVAITHRLILELLYQK